MSRFRPSIAGLLGLILAFGLGLATPRGSNPCWHFAAVLLTLAALMSAILGVIFRRGRGRGFWAGFALCGWTFFRVVAPAPLGDLLHGPRDYEVSEIPDALEGWFHPNIAQERPPIYRDHFERIVASEPALLIALAGGFVGRALAAGAGPSARDGEPPDTRRTA